jgi:hypothetical protein
MSQYDSNTNKYKLIKIYLNDGNDNDHNSDKHCWQFEEHGTGSSHHLIILLRLVTPSYITLTDCQGISAGPMRHLKNYRP